MIIGCRGDKNGESKCSRSEDESEQKAKTNLSKLIEQALNGEEVVIAKAGKPLVRLVPVRDEKEDCFGMDAGKGWIADDFDVLPDDLLAAFYGEDDESFD